MQTSSYLLANERDALWGLTVSTVGYEEISPGEDYPTKGHADGYYFNLEKGRVLDEYQLLYNPEGEGVFQSTHCPETPIKAGDMFLLFPGEWHSYHPNPHTGWKSHWIGFKGKNMDDRVTAGFLTPEKPIYHVGYSFVLEGLYQRALDEATKENAYSQQLMAGIVNHLIGMMYSLERNIELNKNHLHVDMINRARLSNFRKLFKEYTGLSPATYQQDLRLLRAKELLSTTDLTIKEIAYRLNFESPDYFSAKFKAKMGCKPSEIR